MKSILLAISLFAMLNSNAQDPDLYYRDQQTKAQEEDRMDLTPDSILHKSGLVLKTKNKLKIGAGTMPDGSFKYIRINASSLMSYIGGNPNATNTANALPPNFSGMNSEILKLQRRGNKKFGYQDYAIIKLGGIARYEVDITNAISFGEIDVPEAFRPQAKALQIELKGATLSIADELVKLKKLVDDGILTKEEFEAQKKKLLDKKEK